MAPWPGDNWDNTDRNRPADGVRYGVLFGILILVVLLILAMWFHARRRIQRGQGPMAYHRWLVARPRRYPDHATQQQPPPMPARDFSFYNQNQQQGTNMGPVPPPLYTPTPYSPPGYAPKMRGGEGAGGGVDGGGGEGSLQRPMQAHMSTVDVGPPQGPPPEYRG